MNARSPFLARAVFSILIAAALGCDAEPEATVGGSADTAGGDGLSSEQIQSQVQPMTPEQARDLGIIDSVGQGAQPAPTGPSSVIPGAAPPAPPADSVG